MKYYYVLLLGLIFLCSQTKADDFFDPTQPPESIEKYAVNDDLSTTKLNMIFYHENSSLCMINGVSYKEGDFFGRFLIEKILKNKVILTKNGKKIVLALSEHYS